MSIQKISKKTIKKSDIRLVFTGEILEKIRNEALKDKRTMINLVTKIIIEYFENKENLIIGEK